MSLPKTTPVFEKDEAARINKKQFCKQDVFQFFYRNFGSSPFPPPPADYIPPVEAVAAATSVILINATTLMHKSALSTNNFGNNHFAQKHQKQNILRIFRRL